MTDEELVQLIATLRDEDPVPVAWRFDPPSWLRYSVSRLVRLGVMDEPDAEDDLADVLARARVACRLRLAMDPDTADL